MECVVFQARSGYGLFRKPYTTTSALTYSCIHPVAVKGLVGAIIGIERSILRGATEDVKVGIRVLSPLQKTNQSVKLLSAKREDYGKMFHFPANIQFIRNPVYELYISGPKEILDELEMRIKNQNPVYTPALGLSEYIAKLEFVGRFEVESCESDRVDSIIPENQITDVKYFGCDIQRDEIPTKNDEKRMYTEYKTVIFGFDREDKICGLTGKTKGVYEIGDKRIFMFE